MSFAGTRLIKTYTMRVPAAAAEVFPLLCPVREYDWVDYWQCELLFTDSGVAEPNCVFRTRFGERGEMIWTVTRYEPPRAVQFTVFKPDSHVWNLEIVLAERSPAETELTWTHTYTGITDAGNRYLSEYTDDQHKGHLLLMERALIHYLKTGTMLDLSAPAG